MLQTFSDEELQVHYLAELDQPDAQLVTNIDKFETQVRIISRRLHKRTVATVGDRVLVAGSLQRTAEKWLEQAFPANNRNLNFQWIERGGDNERVLLIIRHKNPVRFPSLPNA